MNNTLFEKYKTAMKADDYGSWVIREECTKKYSWAIPTEKAIKLVASFSPIVEMGAGTGYWASLIQQAGADIIAYDKSPPKISDNKYANKEQYFDVKKGNPNTLKDHSDRALFLCWPPYADSFAHSCITTWKGDTLIYVGESGGGCTADDDFFDVIDERFEKIKYLEIPQWPGIHDVLFVWKRK